MKTYARGFALSIGLIAILGACAEREEILQGERLGLRDQLTGIDDEEAQSIIAANDAAIANFTASAPKTNAAWTHTGGSAQQSIAHPSLRKSIAQVWSADIGTAAGGRTSITATPVVAENRVYAMDGAGLVSAFGTNGGTLWQADLRKSSDLRDAISGGGLAYGDGTLVATTGYGEVVALDPLSGAIRWRHRLNASVSGAPLITNGLVVAVATNGEAIGLSLDLGRIEWQLQSTVPGTGVSGGGTAAALGNLAIIPFPNGEVSGVVTKNGFRAWSQVITGARLGASRGFVSAIAAAPVVSDGIIYAGTQSGRLSAIDARTGARDWTARDGAVGLIWPEGNALFVLTDENRLKRLSKADGQPVWSRDLPSFENPDRRRRAVGHFGPVLAGGRLYVGGSDGMLRVFDPMTGSPLSEIEIPSGVASAPVVAGGRLYLIAKNARLYAFQ